jgi:plastocyanin
MSVTPTDPAVSAAPPARRRRATRVIAIVLAALVLITAVTALPAIRRALLDPAGRDPVPGVTRVEVRDDPWEYFAYSPPVIEVPVGTEVTWVFDSRAPHDVVFEDQASPLMAAGSWSRSFDAPGSYAYRCTLHTNMDGRVQVSGS